MHTVSKCRFLTLFERGKFPFICMAIHGRWFLKMKISCRNYRMSCQRRQGQALSRPRMFATSLWATNSRICSCRWRFASAAFPCWQYSSGLQSWSGTTMKWRKECILMVMKETTLWPIDRPSFIDGQNMKWDSNFGMTVTIPFAFHPIVVPSSLSHMMSQHSFKTMKEKLARVIKTVKQLLNWKVMANHSWCQTF